MDSLVVLVFFMLGLSFFGLGFTSGRNYQKRLHRVQAWNRYAKYTKKGTWTR